ncbi:MAG: glycosyltransferase [Candidatus Omnitrophota bacterium]
MDLISTIIPTYNSEAFIKNTVESVLAQDYKNIELSIVNDGSTDNTEKVLRPYFDRIVYIKQENKGKSAALNLGIESAKGELLAFLDHDDLWLPHKLTRQYKYFRENPDVALIYSDLIIATDDGKQRLSSRRMKNKPGQACDFYDLLTKNYITTSTIIIKKECILKVGLFDAKYMLSNDYDMYLRLARHYRFGYIEEPLTIYRQRQGNLTSRFSENMYQEHIDIAKSISKLFPELKLCSNPIWKKGLSEHYFEFGIEHFYKHHYKEAGEKFFASLKYNKLNLKSMMYFLLTQVPPNFLDLMRRLKPRRPS